MSDKQIKLGFVKNEKLVPLKENHAEEASRARKNPLVSAHLAKVIKKAAKICDLMTEEDVRQDLKVLRAAKKATHRIYDTEKKKLIKVPDHKTRLAATTLSRAYHEGLPVQRSVTVSGGFDELSDMLKEAKESGLKLIEVGPSSDSPTS